MKQIFIFLLIFVGISAACSTSANDSSTKNTIKVDTAATLPVKKKTAVVRKDTVKPDSAFKRLQLKHKNPQIAYAEKEAVVRQLIENKNIDYASMEVLFRTIKAEQILEVWAKDRTKNDTFQLVKNYKLCVDTNPDTLRGIDLLVPESFYYVKYFHPANPYFVRMEINFPNKSDRIRGRSGGDIAIHGGCYSTYCSPFTDDDIKELYVFAVEAKSKGQKQVAVHNFPFRMTDKNVEKYRNDARYKNRKKLIFNRDNMKYGFQYFEKHRKLFSFTVDKKGKYIYQNADN